MKKTLPFIGLLLILCTFLVACSCEHLDRNGDGRCDKCVARMPEETTDTAQTTASTTAPLPSFRADAEITELLEAGLATARLGDRLDIGLTAETAQYYHIDGEGEYLRINADGTLEVIGIRHRRTILTLSGHDGRAIFRGFYSVMDTPLSGALRQALFDHGLIAAETADAPASALAALTALSLENARITDPTELAALRYLTKLTSLDLSYTALGDLSYLSGLTKLSYLDLSYAANLSLSDGGITACLTLSGLTALEDLNITGAYAAISREVYDHLASMAANGEIRLTVMEGVTLAPQEVDDFGATVFFSFDEYLAHLNRHQGVLTPSAGFSHAILVYSTAEHAEDSPIDATHLSVLELYGKNGCYYHTPITTPGSLTVRLSSFSLRAPRENHRAGIDVGGALTLVAVGSCSVYGGGWDSPEVTYLLPSSGIVAASLDVYAFAGASLAIEGGRGEVGHMGVTDNWSPSDPITQKNGGIGGNGAAAIYVTGDVTFHSTEGIVVRGGKGGRGGDGADGGKDPTYILAGAYNAGHGGKGGTGGAAVDCARLLFAETVTSDAESAFYFSKLCGGAGGNGGTGGDGYLAGQDGTDGGSGNDGNSVAYH